jgi:hypothetical protein
MNPGRLGLLGAPTYPMLRDATQATLLEILDGNGIGYEHNKAENTLLMKDTGSRILFRAVEEFERLRGTNLAWFGLDELTYTQEESWLRLEGRLRDPKATRLCGFAVWTPKGYDWVYRKFVTDRVRGYDLVSAAPFENRYLLDRITDFYDRLRESYDEKFYEQEVLGLYVNMEAGRVYPAFNRNDHVAVLPVEVSRPLLWALDFNVDPMCSVVAQLVRGKMRVLDEIVIRHATTEQACEMFMKRYPRHSAGVRVYGDASGHQSQTSGSSDYQMVMDYLSARSPMEVEYCTPKKNPHVRERVNLMNKMLRSAAGDVALLVDEKCKELVKDLEQVCYRAGSNQIDKDRDRMRTHLSDALGYLVWHECREQPPIGEQSRSLFLS